MLKEKEPVEQPSVSLSSHDFVEHERNHYWYIGVTLLLIVLVFAAIYIKDYLVALVVVALGLAIFRLAKVEPTKKEIKVSGSGVYWGDQFFPYHQLRAFWFNSIEGKTTFHLERLNFNPEISFVVSETAQGPVFSQLLERLPWHHLTDEGIGDKFGRWFKI